MDPLKDDQDMFDKVVLHLLKQGKRSTRESHVIVGDKMIFAQSGAYRGDDGLKCAIGCLIPDELYGPWMEGREASKVIEHPSLAPLFVNVDSVIVDELQNVHDDEPPVRWIETLQVLARKRGLDWHHSGDFA